MTNEPAHRDSVIEFDDVHITYRRPGGGTLRAVDGVSFDVARGEVVGLVGESGCGKSTLARATCGLVPVASGEIRFLGEPVRPLKLRRRPQRELGIQMVFQNPYSSLNPRRAIGTQIADGLAASTHPAPPSVPELLDMVGLDPGLAGRFPHSFSGGQRQRIAIARALAANPTMLIGDEPIASLDASLQSRIARLMRDLAQLSNTALLFITHDLAIVREIADRIVVMKAGRLVEEGTADEVWNSPKEAYTRELLAAIPVADGQGRLPGVVPRDAD